VAEKVLLERAPCVCLHVVCHGSSLAQSIHPGGKT
jgi:hypothetical protein